MIVTSQECFLNVLTQLYPKDVLLDATYYIADLTGPGGISHLNSDRGFGGDPTMYMDEETYRYEDGQLIKTGSPISVNTLQRFHVHYSILGVLNPTSLLTSSCIGPDEKMRGPQTPEVRFINSLKQPDSASAVYNELFYHQLRGNGLQIIIYTNNKICCMYGWIVCEYLSQCFGADIIFLDAKYRKKIAPQSKVVYNGNKQFAHDKFIPWIRDYDLLEGFEAALTRSNLSESVSNITAKLNVMDWNGLIHLYNLIWPNDPLPPGNYSTDQLKEIIMSRIIGQRRPTSFDALSNLYAADEFYNMANEYDE